MRLRRFGYIDHYYHDHGYITFGYLDINIKGYVYSNSSATTPVNSVRVVTCVPDTSAVTAGGKRGEMMMTERRRRRKRKTSNPVASVRFTPATTDGEC